MDGRIPTEMDAGTMTLYYYVRNKADIVALMQDAIFEGVLVPADAAGNEQHYGIA
jgi:hypothetical protein